MSYNVIVCGGYVLPMVRILGLPPDIAGETVKRIGKDGVSGYAFKRMGAKAEESFFVTEAVAATPGIAFGILLDQKSFQGYEISIFDGFGVEFSGFVCLRVRMVQMKRVAYVNWEGVGYSAPVILTSQWTVQYPYSGG